MGDFHVGVQSDDAGVLRRIERAYADRAVVDGEAVDDLAVVVHPPRTSDGVRKRSSLSHGGCDLVRSSSVDRLLRGLDCFLAGVADAPADASKVSDMGAVVRHGRASLVPTSLLERSSGVERTISAAGAALADAVSVLLDPIAGEVVVRPGLVGDDRLEIDSDLVPVPGRYALHRIHWPGDATGGQESPGTGLVRLINRMDLSSSTAPAFEGVVRLAGCLSDIRVVERGVSDLEAILEELDS